ncbi:MAG: type VI secretion system lipoprotein TssJ [Planctomycetota bacterium]|jgi:type VI secretion system protein VasD|nr:type VI secretion system lipoprotein TssJ [Planctomycetota bacterium]
MWVGKGLWAILVTILVLGLSGCGRASSVYVRATDSINLNDANQATPVDIRFYQLKNINTFKTAEFDALWADAAAVLGGDLLGEAQVVTIHPGDGQTKPREIILGPWDKDAQSLGVMAQFSTISGDKDRRRVVVSAWHADDYVIELNDNELHFRKH